MNEPNNQTTKKAFIAAQSFDELACDVAEIKTVLFGQNEDGLVATIQETRGAWRVIKWVFGSFGALFLTGLVLLFVEYVSAPYKYAKIVDVNKIVTEQAVMSEKMTNMGNAFQDLTKELQKERRP